jgi:nucleoid-associated protein YgaU
MGLTKATITNRTTNEAFSVLFNPTEYSVTKTVTWTTQQTQGENAPKSDFTGGAPQTMDMTLFFDVSEQPNADVRNYVNKLVNLTKIDTSKRNSSSGMGRPPLCLFQWGSHWYFTAAITSLKVTYTLFREDGTPIRANAVVSFKEVEDDEPLPQNPTSHSEPGRKRREVRPQDTLATIAYEEYGDPNKWRMIADVNQLDDPLGIRPGQVLAIPALN